MILIFIYIFDYYFRMNIFYLYVKTLKLKEWKAFFNNFPIGILMTKGNNLKFINTSLIKTLNLDNEGESLFDFQENNELTKNIYERLSEIKEKDGLRISILDLINKSNSQSENKNYIMCMKHENSEKFFEVNKDYVPLGNSECQAFIFKEITSLILYKNMVEKEKFLKESFASITHDMRNPLGCIITSLSNFKNAQNLNDQEELISISLSSAELLLCSVNDILDLNQMENNKLKLVFDKINIKQVVIDCINIMKINFQIKGLFLRGKFETQIPQQIFSDKNRIKGIVLNILSNSLKFTRKGGVSINVRMSSNIEYIKITVKDTGKGIEESQQKKIFQKFGKIEGNSLENPTGVGIGLNFSKKVTKMLGGDIKFRSKENQGTKFVIWIPVQGNPENHERDKESNRFYTSISSISVSYNNEEEKKELQNERIQISEAAKTFLPNIYEEINNINQNNVGIKNLAIECPRVLIVDDNESIHFALNSMLKRYFVSCASVYCGEEAIEFMKRSSSFNCVNKGISVIFMDINMNGRLNGYETTAELKKLMNQKLIRKAVIIGLSGEESNKGNMDEIIIKPLRSETLENIVKMYIND